MKKRLFEVYEALVEATMEHWHLVAYVALSIWAIFTYATAAKEASIGTSPEALAGLLRSSLAHLDHIFFAVLGFLIVNALRLIQVSKKLTESVSDLSTNVQRGLDDDLVELLKNAERHVNPELSRLMEEAVRSSFGNVRSCIQTRTISFKCVDPLEAYYARALAELPKATFYAVSLPSKKYLWDEQRYPHIYASMQRFIESGGRIYRLFVVSTENERNWADEEREIIRRNRDCGVIVRTIPRFKVGDFTDLRFFLVEGSGRVAFEALLRGGEEILEISVTVDPDVTKTFRKTYDQLAREATLVRKTSLAPSAPGQVIVGEWLSSWQEGEDKNKWVRERVRIEFRSGKVILENSDNDEGYEFSGAGDLHDDKYFYGTWRSRKPASNATGTFSFYILPQGDAIVGQSFGPDRSGKHLRADWVMGKDEKALGQARKWIQTH